jgi:hypothetical protein
MGQSDAMAALAELERRELPMIMAPRMADDPSPMIADLAMDEEPRRKPPAPAPAEVEIGSLVHAQCGEVVVTGTVTCIERSAIATVYYIHSPHGNDYQARLVALVEIVTADPAEPTWQQTAENLRDALALTTAERDDARRERDAAMERVRRLEKLFDDAGQGEHNVLALVDHYAAQASAGQDAQRIVREMRDLLTVVNDGPEGPMPPSWYLGQIRQLLGLGITAEYDAVTLDLSGPEIGGES